MSAVDYLLIGHITADIVQERRVIGGTVSYAASTARAFDLAVGVLTSARADEPLLAELGDGVDCVTVDAPQTTTYENIYTPQGRNQYVRAVARPLTTDHIPEKWRDAPLVHLAPIADEVQPEIACLFPNAIVMVTLQGWLRRWGDDQHVQFKRWFDSDVLKDIDIVVFSEEDIADDPQLELDIAGVAKHLIVTRAEKGGTYYHHGEASQFTTPRVEVTNPTGAGDIFAASLLSALKSIEDMHTAIKIAALLASNSVTRTGLDGVPTYAEVRQAMG